MTIKKKPKCYIAYIPKQFDRKVPYCIASCKLLQSKDSFHQAPNWMERILEYAPDLTHMDIKFLY